MHMVGVMAFLYCHYAIKHREQNKFSKITAEATTWNQPTLKKYTVRHDDKGAVD